MIDLTDYAFEATEPGMPDFGVVQKPVLGGVINRINRVGGGSTIGVMFPARRFEPHGRRLIPLLHQAKREGAKVRYSQPGFNVGAPGEPTVDGAHAGGTALNITGATPNYCVSQGQALNITKSGRTYLYFAAAQTILDVSGDGELTLSTPLRTQLAGGEDVSLGLPVIEGWIVGDNLSWPISRQRVVGLQLTIQERA